MKKLSHGNKVIIVGAGPGGLASAMLLAKSGMKVTVIERLPNVGGRTSAIEAQGFRFDLGPTFFLYPRILREIFQACGRDLDVEVPMVKLDPQYRLVFGAGGELNATPNVERMVAEIAKIAPRDAASFRRFMDENRVKLEKFEPCLQRPFLGWKSMASTRLLRLLPALKPWRSLHKELSSYFADPRLQLAFTFQSKYLGMSPFQCPSLFSILSFLEYEHGVFHPIGGCAAVTEAMARIAREMGVDIRLDEPVEELTFQGRRATGARTRTGWHQADAVMLNADFARTMTKLVPDKLRRRWTDRKIATKKFSCSTFMMYLGIEGRYDHLAHHNIYVAKDYERNLEEIERRHVLSADPSVYVQNACISDPSLAPRGQSTLYVLAPVTHQHENVDWSRERDRFRGLVLRQLGKLGIQDIESRIRYERVVTPADWESTYEIHRGATFNLSHTLGQMLHLRPQNRFEDLDGVYLVGGGTHPGSGLPVIFESARISSKLIVDDLGGSQTLPTPPAPAYAEVIGS